MADRKITVEFLGDSRDLNAAASSSERRMSSWGSKLKKVGKVAAVGLAVGAVVAGKALYDMTKAAAEDQAGQVALAQTLKKTTGATDDQIASVEDWITAQGRALGVADDDLRPALQRLSEATGSVSKAQHLASIAMDVSAGTGKSLKSVSEALMKAQNGNVGALGRLGIKTKDAEGKTLSFKDAVKNMADTFEGQASAKADTLKGKMDRLKLIFSETGESIGAKLIPVISKMADWFLQKGVPAISKTWSWIAEKLGPVFRELGDWISQNVIPPLQDLVEHLKGQLPGAWAAVQGAIKDARPYLEVVGKIIANVLIPVFKKIAENVIPMLSANIKILGKVFGAVGSIFKFVWNNLIQPVLKFLVLGISKVMDVFGDMLEALSHVPGFGWAKDAADKLHRAADETRGFANELRKIPPRVNTTITTTYVSRNGPGGQGAGGGLGGDPALPKTGGGGSSSKGKGSTWGTTTAGRVASKSSSVTAGGVTINFNGIVTDPRAVAREIQRILLVEKRLTGDNLGLA